MLSTMTNRQAMSWAWSGEESSSDLQPRWLRELQSQESLSQIDRATKFVHIRRGSKTWSTVLQQIQDSYKLNYVEVEIGPPKPGRDGADRGPFIKLCEKNEVNYSTIIFPDRDKKSDSTGSENRNSVGNGTSKSSHHKLERKNSKKTRQQQKEQKLLQKQQFLREQQENVYMMPQADTIDSIIVSPPTSPLSRRRALSTPTRNRKFPTEAELADAIKARKERIDQDPSIPPPLPTSTPKTRTLPSREKPWIEDEMQVQEPVIMSKQEHRLMKENSQDESNSMQSNRSAELSSHLRAMHIKVRRKSSGEGYPFDLTCAPEHHVTSIQKSSSFGPQDLSLAQEPCPEIDDTKQPKPPVLKKSKSEVDSSSNKFGRRKKTNHKSGDSDLRLASSGDHSPNGSEASSPRDPSEPKSAKEKFRFNFPFLKPKSRGSPDGQSMKCSSNPAIVATDSKAVCESKQAASLQHRKPVPLPRGQGRESSIEGNPDVPCSPKYNDRPIPSPPIQSQQSQTSHQSPHPWIDSPSFRQTEDEMYMNVAFSKPNKLPLLPQQHVLSTSQTSGGSSSPGLEQPPLHRYENVFLEDRVERLPGSASLDRQSSADSPRGSIEMNRPVPAPRYHSGDVTTSTASNHGNHGHVRKESWGNAATFASHGIPPHRMSPKHESPSGSPRMNEQSAHLKNIIASSLAAVHNNHMAQTGRSMSVEGVNVKSKSSSQGHGTRSDSHGNQRGNTGDILNRCTRGHRGSNASLGPAGDTSGGNKLRKMSQDRTLPPFGFATQPWYYGKMLRQECEYLMLSQGQSCQYLVRDSSHRVGDLMLSVLYGTKVHHYVIQTTQEGKFQIAHHDFNSVEDILEFYHHHVIMYSPTQEPVYLRDPFILNH